MTKFLLAVHVIAAILAVGPVAVAASMFPPAARRALADGADGIGADAGAGTGADGTLRLLHRICRVYAVVGVVVPVFGFATASEMGVLGSAWLIVSIALTALAALVLVALVLPGQTALLERPERPERFERGGGSAQTARLAMATGLFNLLWATVTVLMIVRPGSTTGA
ncbi:membrane protein [Streptomyces sp. NRRL S-1022]|uniref:membrane protein n=1 Tax=Streptomyces sp. NRRL S-1022 TaxID=1463880 RepID=UPI0004C20443|nr:membrane protein [Streptomyces sp. NRRL S-1022]